MKYMRLVRAACLLLLPFSILNFAPFAYSEERPSIFLEDFTWTELRDEIGTGKTTVAILVGQENDRAQAEDEDQERAVPRSGNLIAFVDVGRRRLAAVIAEGSCTGSKT